MVIFKFGRQIKLHYTIHQTYPKTLLKKIIRTKLIETLETENFYVEIDTIIHKIATLILIIIVVCKRGNCYLQASP